MLAVSVLLLLISAVCGRFAGISFSVPADTVGGGVTGCRRLADGFAVVFGRRRRRSGGYADSASDSRYERAPPAAGALGRSAGSVAAVIFFAIGVERRLSGLRRRRIAKLAVLNAVRR